MTATQIILAYADNGQTPKYICEILVEDRKPGVWGRVTYKVTKYIWTNPLVFSMKSASISIHKTDKVHYFNNELALQEYITAHIEEFL